MSLGRPRAFVGHRPMADRPSSLFEPPPPRSRRPERREFPSRRPWWGTPKNELGAPVPLRLILGLTDRVAVAVVGATAYTTVVSLTVSVRRRESLAANDFEDVDEFYDDPFERPLVTPVGGGGAFASLPPRSFGSVCSSPMGARRRQPASCSRGWTWMTLTRESRPARCLCPVVAAEATESGKRSSGCGRCRRRGRWRS
jgi:hypothetical protein